MVRMSVPPANRCVANECRRVCTVACLRMPAFSRAAWMGLCIEDAEQCQRCMRLVSGHCRITLEGKTNCQIQLFEALGYFRASAPGRGAWPAPRFRSWTCTSRTLNRCCSNRVRRLTGRMVSRSLLPFPALTDIRPAEKSRSFTRRVMSS